jgi:hypothetical protein
MFGSRHDDQYDANPAAVAEDLEAECNTIASPLLCLKPELYVPSRCQSDRVFSKITGSLLVEGSRPATCSRFILSFWIDSFKTSSPYANNLHPPVQFLIRDW